MEVYIDDNKPAVITESKTFRFNFIKKVESSLKHDIHFIVRHNEFLAEHTIKNEISWLLFKYKHANKIHEHGKQQNEWTTQICS